MTFGFASNRLVVDDADDDDGREVVGVAVLPVTGRRDSEGVVVTGRRGVTGEEDCTAELVLGLLNQVGCEVAVGFAFEIIFSCSFDFSTITLLELIVELLMLLVEGVALETVFSTFCICSFGESSFCRLLSSIANLKSSSSSVSLSRMIVTSSEGLLLLLLLLFSVFIGIKGLALEEVFN